MATAVTQGISVTAKAFYEPTHSDPNAGRFTFAYRITILNTGPDTVRLLRRHWLIHDSLAPSHEVEGPGVVGETPVLAPGEQFTYSSACVLRSSMGRMQGSYLMERVAGGQRFRVSIPPFRLLFPYGAN